MKKIMLFFCFSVVFIGCKTEVPLQFTTKTYDLESTKDSFDGNRAYVHLEIPIASGNELITNNVNQVLYGFVSDVLYFNNQPETDSYNTLAKQFISEYEEINRVYPQSSIAWEANFNTQHHNLSEKVYQVVWNYYTFTGGAHGFSGTKVFFFDLKTGKTIPAKDLFVNYEGFRKYAEAEFRKQMDISGSFTEAGFNMGENLFTLPENFYETGNQWFLHYNPYEISSYAQGSSVVKLPKKEVERFLNPIYFKN